MSNNTDQTIQFRDERKLGSAIADWLAVCIGWKFGPVLLVGYGTWGIGILLIDLSRNLLAWK
jgi:hypothetical protein